MQLCGNRYGRPKEKKKIERGKTNNKQSDEAKRFKYYENWRCDTRRDETAKTERGAKIMIEGSNCLQTKKSEKWKGKMR